jgi:hypothetical protein
MLLTRRKQPSKALLKDVGKAAGRIAEESRSAAGTARSELGGLGAELRDQAAEALTQARLATAARLAGAAETVQPSGKRRRRRLRFVIPAVIGGVFAAKMAKVRREKALAERDEIATGETDHQTAAAVASATTPGATKAKQGTARDDTNGKERAKQSAAQSSTATK